MSVFWRPRDCVLWFDFAELQGDKVYDLSGNGNHGTIYGATWRRGPLIGRLYFDGVDDYVDLSAMNSDLLEITSISVEMLIKVHTAPETQFIALTKNWDWALWVNSDICFAMYHKGIDNISRFLYACDAAGIVNKWYHLMYVYNYNTGFLGFYMNGKLVDYEENVPPVRRTIYYNSIGCNFNRTNFANVTFALVRVYNRALTEKEIKAHYAYLTSLARQVV